MKNKIKLLGIIAIVAIIGFSFLTCELGEEEGEDEKPVPVKVIETDGSMTITGLDEYKGGWVRAYSPTKLLYACAEITEPTKDTPAQVTLAKVSDGGNAVLKVWKTNAAWDSFYSYGDNDQGVVFDVYHTTTQDVTSVIIGTVTVYFTGNGKAGEGTFIKN